MVRTSGRPKRGSRPGPGPLAPGRHALLAPAVVNVFQVLDVGVTLWDAGRWREIYEQPYSRLLSSFELEHGVEAERIAYNNRCLAEASHRRRPVIARHAGHTDLFVPVPSAGRARAVIVIGPVATARPTSTDVLERWRSLTGGQGHPADPEFSHYLDVTLSTLVLEGPRFAKLRELALNLALLVSGACDADDVYAEIESLGRELAEARLPDRMWEIARAMVDERTSRAWASPVRRTRREAIGLTRFPEQLAVGLLVDRKRGSDPVDELIRRDALQRACIELARRAGNAASGKVGGHGVTLLVAGRGSTQRTRRHVLDLADEAASIARRRFGLGLHVGIAARPGPLPEQYHDALAAAESALAEGARMQSGGAVRAARPLGALRRELVALIDEDPRALPACFDRYLEAVAVRSGYRFDPASAYLEAALEDVTGALRASSTLDAKSVASVETGLTRAAVEAGTVNELFSVYRRTVNDIANAVFAPRSAPRERSLLRGEEYMRKHYAEALTLARVAHVAGFARSHFSRLFHAKQGVTFEAYLTRLRIERAQQLLSGTELGLTRVAQLCGFSTRHYFGRVFRRATGETPMRYRRRTGRERGV